MKNLLLAITLLFTFSIATAQSGGTPFYPPSGGGDGLITSIEVIGDYTYFVTATDTFIVLNEDYSGGGAISGDSLWDISNGYYENIEDLPLKYSFENYSLLVDTTSNNLGIKRAGVSYEDSGYSEVISGIFDLNDGEGFKMGYFSLDTSGVYTAMYVNPQFGSGQIITKNRFEIESDEIEIITTSEESEFRLQNNEGLLRAEYFEISVDSLSFNNLTEDNSKPYLLGFQNSSGGFVSTVDASNYKTVPMKYNEVNVADGDTINFTQKTSLLSHTLNIGDTIDVYLNDGGDYYTDLYLGSCCNTGVIRLNSLAASPQGFPMYLNGYELVKIVNVGWQQFAIKEFEF